MLIGIISDTHENMDVIKKAVEIFNSKNVNLVVHAGDIISPITFTYFSKLNCKMYLVFGNNDGEKKMLKEKYSQIGLIQEPPLEFEIKDEDKTLKFIVFHAPPQNLEELAFSNKYGYIIYGHTHKKDFRKIGNTAIINPGEAGGWLFNNKSIVLLDTKENKVEFVDI
jgi:putative phosphoesterase